MFNGLEAFQKDHGLKADRYARPGGETEMKLNEVPNQGIASKALKPALPILRLDNGLKASKPPMYGNGLLHRVSGVVGEVDQAGGLGVRPPYSRPPQKPADQGRVYIESNDWRPTPKAARHKPAIEHNGVMGEVDQAGGLGARPVYTRPPRSPKASGGIYI